MDREPQTIEEIDAERARELEILAKATRAAEALLAEKAAATGGTPTKTPDAAVTTSPKTPDTKKGMEPTLDEKTKKEIDDLLQINLSGKTIKELLEIRTRLETLQKVMNEDQIKKLKPFIEQWFEEKYKLEAKENGADNKPITPEEAAAIPPIDLGPEGIKLEEKLEEARLAYAAEFKKFVADRRKKEGEETGWRETKGFTEKLNKAKGYGKKFVRFFNGSSVKESELTEELKNLEKEYDKSAAEYGKAMFEAKKAELATSGKSEKEQKSELLRFKQDKIFTRVIVEEQARLSALKVENLPPKEKGIARKSLEWYMKQSRVKKLIISTVLATTLITSFSAVFSSAAVTGVGVSTMAGVRLARGAVGSVVGQTVAKAYDLLFKEKSAAKRKQAEDKLAETFKEETFDIDIAKSKKEYDEIKEKEFRAKRNRLITKGVITLAAGIGTSYGISHSGILNIGQGAPIEGVAKHGTSNEELMSKLLGKNADTTGKFTMPNPDDHSAQAEQMRILGTLKPGESAEKAFHQFAPAEEVAGVAKTAEQLNHSFSLTQPTEFEVKGPAELEHAYEKLLLSRHLPEKLPGEVVLDKIAAARTLNEAANLVRLTEGDGAAGISAEDFAKVVEFKNGTLHILNADKLNEYMDKVHDHSGQIDTTGAGKYTGNVKWIEKIHGDNMHGSAEHPGIIGHPEATPDHIGEMPKPFTPEDVVRAKVSSIYEELQGRPSINDTLENPQNMNWIDRADTTINPTPVENNILDPNNPMFQEHISGVMEGKPVIDATYNPYEDMTRAWSPEDAKIVYENTIQHLYPQNQGFNDNGNWLRAKDTPALEIFNANVPPDDIVYGPVVDQMHKIEEVTGLIPKGETWFRSAETVAKYIMRGTQKAAEMGTEAMQKIRVP